MAEWLPNPRWVRSHVATFNLQLCKSRGVRCQASASYHRVAPQTNTCRTRSTPLRLSDVSRARHARTRRSTTYHSIYINSAFVVISPSFPRPVVLRLYLGGLLDLAEVVRRVPSRQAKDFRMMRLIFTQGKQPHLTPSSTDLLVEDVDELAFVLRFKGHVV